MKALPLALAVCACVACVQPHAVAPNERSDSEANVCLDLVVATPVTYELVRPPVELAMLRRCGASEWSDICDVSGIEDLSFGDLYLGASARLEPASMNVPYAVCRIAGYRSMARAEVLSDGRLGEIQIGMTRGEVLSQEPGFHERWYSVFDVNERLVFAARRVREGESVAHMGFDEYHGNSMCDLVAVGTFRSGVAWVLPIPSDGNVPVSSGGNSFPAEWSETGFFFISGVHRYDLHAEICEAAGHFGVLVEAEEEPSEVGKRNGPRYGLGFRREAGIRSEVSAHASPDGVPPGGADDSLCG